jgi:hypothetical protein
MAFFFSTFAIHEQGKNSLFLPALRHTIAQMGGKMPQLR